MRQGQQHRRGRTRGGQNNNHGNNNNNNNRKGQNPISRTYQSNGPDGKVSGTASGIAEKYLSLARDATTSGDPVLAENYLQHAEHYNRIILAYRESQAQAGEDGGQRVRTGQPGEASDTSDENGEDEGESYGRDMQPLPPVEAPARQNDQQPRAFDNPRPEPREPRGDNNPRYDDRQPRFNDGQQRRNNQPRDRYQGERFNNGDRNNDRFNGQPRGDRYQNDRNQGDRQPYGDRQNRDRDQNFQDRQGGDRPYRDRDGGHQRSDNRPDQRSEGRNDQRSDNRPDFRSEPRYEPRQEPRGEQPVREVARPEPPAFVDVPRVDVSASSEQPVIVTADPVVRAPRPPRRERVPAVVSEHEQPEFLRRPVRRPRRDAAAAAEDAAAPPAPADREPTQD